MGERPGHDHGSLIKQALDNGAGAARSALAASWRRSLSLYGLDPEDGGRPHDPDRGAVA
jgi:transcriptional regulator of acetoin/glycerol metabolism